MITMDNARIKQEFINRLEKAWNPHVGVIDSTDESRQVILADAQQVLAQMQSQGFPVDDLAIVPDDEVRDSEQCWLKLMKSGTVVSHFAYCFTPISVEFTPE